MSGYKVARETRGDVVVFARRRAIGRRLERERPDLESSNHFQDYGAPHSAPVGGEESKHSMFWRDETILSKFSTLKVQSIVHFN
jgi:hypothetical protein